MFGISVGWNGGGGGRLDGGWWIMVLGCALAHWAFWRHRLTDRMAALPKGLFAIIYGAAWALVLPWVATGDAPFIYFQF